MTAILPGFARNEERRNINLWRVIMVDHTNKILNEKHHSHASNHRRPSQIIHTRPAHMYSMGLRAVELVENGFNVLENEV